MIDLYSWKSANGRRPIIMLEECGIPYRLIPIDPHGGDNRKPDYLKISPGGKVPCLVDPDAEGGEPIHLMESSAILLYLAEKTGQFNGATGEFRACRLFDTVAGTTIGWFDGSISRKKGQKR